MILSWEQAVGQILVRKLADAVLAKRKAPAAAKKRSAEAELREIITDALTPDPGKRPSLSALAGAAKSGRSQAEVDEFIRDLREEWDR
jgi:plasmid stability protein